VRHYPVFISTDNIPWWSKFLLVQWHNYCGKKASKLLVNIKILNVWRDVETTTNTAHLAVEAVIKVINHLLLMETINQNQIMVKKQAVSVRNHNQKQATSLQTGIEVLKTKRTRDQTCEM
jgi:hypothetical protein